MPRPRGRRIAAAIGVTALALAGLIGLATTVAARVGTESARTHLRDLIVDVTAATAFRYRVTDDLGRDMGPTKIIWVPEASLFAAVYFTFAESDGQFHVQLATSTDVLNWRWRTELANLASQPAIAAAASGGGYVVAWEQEPDPIHLVIAYYATWPDLLGNAVAKRFDVPVTMPACGEGTPSIEAASSDRVQLGFHYHGGCDEDREAGGSTDWQTWSAAARPEIDRALMSAGVEGHIGDRDGIELGGQELMLVEGQMTLDDQSTWRTFLYDATTNRADRLEFRTHAGSRGFSNPTIARLAVHGRDAMVVTLFLQSEAAEGDEAGELIYYRTMPTATGT